MNFRNYGFASSGSKAVSFKRTRTFIAKMFIRLGTRFADLAERIAPWLK